jgi:hypothetical protein
MTPQLERYAIAVCVFFLALGAPIFVHSQAPSVATLRNQLRARYDIVALTDGVVLVPRQREDNIRLIEIRNGAVAINGDEVSAREERERLGQDAELVLRATYLNPLALRDLARADSALAVSQPETTKSTNEPETGSPERTQVHRGDLVHIGGGLTVARDELVVGDVVAIGGSADVDGEVTGDVAVIGGSLNLGPDAVVRRDVSVIGGSLNRSPGARISGQANEVGLSGQAPVGSAFGSAFRRNLLFGRPFSQLGRLLATVLRISLLILSALVVMTLGKRFVQAIADRAAAEPLRSGFVGLLMEVLFVPLLIVTIVVLAVSIIGIPLLLLVPFGIVLAVVLMLIGFTGVASLVGRIVSDRFGIKRGPYASVALGVVVVVGLTLIARLVALAGGLVFGLVVASTLAAVGYLAEYVAWTMGIGAIILTWLSIRRHRVPTTTGTTPAAGEARAE